MSQLRPELDSVSYRREQIDDLVVSIEEREMCATQDEFRAATLDIVEAVLRLKFISKTDERAAWARIMNQLLADIVNGSFTLPFKFDQEDGQDVLCIRTSDVMSHLMRSQWLRDCWEDMPIRTDRGLKKWLKLAGVLLMDDEGSPREFERTLGGRRVSYMTAIRLSELAMAGVQTFPASQVVYRPSKP